MKTLIFTDEKLYKIGLRAHIQRKEDMYEQRTVTDAWASGKNFYYVVDGKRMDCHRDMGNKELIALGKFIVEAKDVYPYRKNIWL